MGEQQLDGFEDLRTKFRVRKEALEKKGHTDIDNKTLAVMVVGAEIIKAIKVTGTAIFADVHALRMATLGQIEEIKSEEDGKPKIHRVN